MDRRLQLGTRENPASNGRHGSRFVVRSERASECANGEEHEQRTSAVPNRNTIDARHNAAHQVATGGERSPFASDQPKSERQLGRAVTEIFEPLIGSGQAARLLGNIHVKTLQRYARLGRIPGYQIGGHWYFRESELDAWLRHQINSKRQFVR